MGVYAGMSIEEAVPNAVEMSSGLTGVHCDAMRKGGCVTPEAGSIMNLNYGVSTP